MCVLFITASERPASATAVGCFACNSSSALVETNLHLWFHIIGRDVPLSFSLSLHPPLSPSPPATDPSPPCWTGGAFYKRQRSHENSQSRALEHNVGRVSGWNWAKHNINTSKSLHHTQGPCGHSTRLRNTTQSKSRALITLQGFVEVQENSLWCELWSRSAPLEFCCLFVLVCERGWITYRDDDDDWCYKSLGSVLKLKTPA